MVRLKFLINIASIADEAGVTHVSNAEIADVFACFYEQLYTARNHDQHSCSLHGSYLRFHHCRAGQCVGEHEAWQVL